jgi:hypothetical protein
VREQDGRLDGLDRLLHVDADALFQDGREESLPRIFQLRTFAERKVSFREKGKNDTSKEREPFVWVFVLSLPADAARQ